VKEGTVQGGGELVLPPWVKRWGPVLAIIALALVVHFPGLWGEYIWDDQEWLLSNEAVGNAGRFWELWVPGKTPHFFPLVTTSYWIEHLLWGFGPTDANGIQRGVGFHVTNLLLHIGTSVLLFEIVRRLKLKGGVVAAWLAAALFAVHPVNVETVAWVAERKNTLCGVFLFASALFAFRDFELFEGEAPRRRDRVWGVVLFLCAMLSKTTACFLPPALLVMAWWKRGRVTKADVMKSLPYWVIGLGLGILSVVLEKRVAGTEGAAWAFTPVQRVLIAGNAFWFYVEKLLVPYPVHHIYARWPIEAGKPVTEGWLWIRPVLFVGVVAALAAFRKRLPRGPLAAMLLFAGGLFPALGFISFYTMLYTFVADHYVYLAVPFVLVPAVEGLVWLVGKVQAWAAPSPEDAATAVAVRQWGLGGTAAVWLGLLAFYANVLSDKYRSNVDLWMYAYYHNKTNYFVNTQLAIALMGAKPETPENMQAAMQLVQDAKKLRPEDWRPWHAEGQLMTKLNRPEAAAVALYEAERRMSPAEMRLRDFYLTQGAAEATAGIQRTPEYRRAYEFERQDQWDEAIGAYTEAVAKHPEDWDAWLKLGWCHQIGKNDAAKAVEIYQKVVKAKPEYADAWLYLGYGLRAEGREPEAVEALKTIEKYAPPTEVLRRHPEFLAPRK
jgi:tetratricopeptide (TPR) repeat protein